MMSDPFEVKSLGKGWDAVDEIATKKSSGRWLAIEEGKSVQVNLIGDPEIIEKAPFKPGDPPATRVQVDVFLPDLNATKTWEMSLTTWKQVKRQRLKRAGEFDNALLEVTREGTGTSTKYFIEYERQLNSTEQGMRKALWVNAPSPDEEPIPF